MIVRLLKKIAGLGSKTAKVADPSGAPVGTKGPNQLDLKTHRPNEFAGKEVTINGCTYRIGARFRESNQGYMHHLLNPSSGLCVHAIQIRLEYFQSPAAALEASRWKATANMKLLLEMRLKSPSVGMGFLTVREAHGGSFELHEMIDGSTFPGQTALAATDEGLRDAQALFNKSDFGGAVSRLTDVLAASPNHTIALNHLAACYSSLGDFPKAYKTCGRAVEIEPNLAHYRAAQISTALRMQVPRAASILFDELQTRYPNLRYFDSYGVRAYLAIGGAGRAADLLGLGAIPSSEAAAFKPIVEAAVGANESFANLESQLGLSHGKPSDDEILRVLHQTNASYPGNPFVSANLAAVLRKAGEFQRAAELWTRAASGLPSSLQATCVANLAYCLISLPDWPRAMSLLTTTMKMLPKSATGEIDPVDVPGLVTWISSNGAVKESIRDASAAVLVERAINDCPDKSLVTPEIREMVALHREFAKGVGD